MVMVLGTGNGDSNIGGDGDYLRLNALGGGRNDDHQY